ncbi:hypothetical protein [Ideonella livida]|uniref:Uncharacterized protein n=1 Tax=Ideonella livida TaxID=2707176 RepID=A0A7C9PJE6_9BURK|nr:hypothetical protein [Ideonella livida]NDY93393.1 hypothetical protein [Ideonella livida]
MAQNNAPTFMVDGIRTIAIHNDVVRVQFHELDQDGKPADVVKLMIPMRQLQQIADALKNIKR